MTQLGLNYSVDHRDRERLSKQCVALLERLQRGAVTNVEIVMDMRIMNATARISELRQAGYRIDAQRGSAGVWTYRLVTA